MADPLARASRRPSNAFSRMFTAFAAGAFLLVSGVIGWEVRNSHGFFRGAKWVDPPIWWQIALGAGLLLLGLYWSRRLGPIGWTAVRSPRRRAIKFVGRGTTAGAATTERRLPSGAAKSGEN